MFLQKFPTRKSSGDLVAECPNVAEFAKTRVFGYIRAEVPATSATPLNSRSLATSATKILSWGISD